MTSAVVPTSPPRRAIDFRWVAIVFATVFVVGFVVAWLMHRTYVSADRVAARHVPADAAGVLRLDLEKVVLFAPVRESLMPLLDELGAPEQPPLEPRWQRLARSSKLSLGRDTREAVVVFGPAPADWALILAGNYPGGVLSGLAELFGQEGKPWRREGERLVSPAGLAVAQASDRSLVLASGTSRLDTVVPSSAHHEALGIPLRGALSFVADPRKLPWLAEVTGMLGQIDEITARADWSSPLVVDVELHYGADPPAELEARVDALFERLLGAGERQRLLATVGRPGLVRTGRVVRIRTRWDHVALERLAERVARLLGSSGPRARG